MTPCMRMKALRQSLALLLANGQLQQWPSSVLACLCMRWLRSKGGQFWPRSCSTRYSLASVLDSNDDMLVSPCPTSASLLPGGDVCGALQGTYNVKQQQDKAIAWRAQDLHRAATAWVTLGSQQLRHDRPAPTLLGKCSSPAAQAWSKADHTVVHSSLWQQFLYSSLKPGFTVSRYLYSDIDATARTVATCRVIQLQHRFPGQLADQALAGCFDMLPADIRNISVQHLKAALDQVDTAVPWLVVAGWPCQDFSLAGPSRGLAADRSRLLFELVRLVGALQQLRVAQPTAYLFENVPMQHHREQHIPTTDFAAITDMLGQPVLFDAAQTGSYAHRLRNSGQICAMLSSSQRLWSPSRGPQAELFNSCCPRLGCPSQSPGRTGVHSMFAITLGSLARHYPPLMSKPSSYAFRPGQPGSIIDYSNPQQPVATEPTAMEREQAMGYLPGTTAAPGVSEQQRCQVIDQSMDANALQVLFATAAAYAELTVPAAAADECSVLSVSKP
eukprot:gene9218-biopygen10908